MGRLFLLICAVLAVSGCAVLRPPEGGYDPMDATPRTYDSEAAPSTLETVGEAVLSVPETVVWWPYKIVSSALRGGYDGVVDGVDRAPVPAVGVVASPLTAAGGVLKGTLKGVARGPAYIGSTGEFGQALGQPGTEPIPLWE